MKLRKVIVFGLLLFALVSLSSCRNEDKYSGKTEVIFELEGGTYQNCTAPVKYYYDLNEGKFIVEPSNITDSKVERSGYELMGWYKTKKIDGTEVTYEDEWNFTEDEISEEGVTLYAYWKKVYKYTFNVCYYDENNELQTLGSYSVKANDKFSDYLNYANKRLGYTPLGFYDEEGNEITNLTHPGGNQDLAINVFVKYIKGTYKIVKNASELKAAKNQNIYLMADIDMNGEALNFGDYKSSFIGNGYTISNFTVNYTASRDSLVEDFTDSNKKSLCISLFGNTDGAHIENVTFKDAKVVVTTTLSTTFRIYVAPLSMSTKNSSFENVSFIGTYDYTRLPSNFNVEENLIFITDQAYYINDGTSTFNDIVLDVNNLKNNLE
jgi:lipoprotein